MFAIHQQDAPHRGEISALFFLWVDKDFCTGGQPSLEDLERLKQAGVKTIVNLRRPQEEGQAGEREKAEELGLEYVVIPVEPAEFRPGQVEEFLSILRAPSKRPIFIHCLAAQRVGGFWIVYRVLECGWSLEDAEAEARRIGLRSQKLIDFARSYIVQHKASAPSRCRDLERRPSLSYA
jgi:uncharacterized protein (TIGR01244 family)